MLDEEGTIGLLGGTGEHIAGISSFTSADEVIDAAEMGAFLGENRGLKSDIMSWII